MALRNCLLLLGMTWAAPALGQILPIDPPNRIRSSEPELQVEQHRFALPVVDYRAPDGSLKRSRGIVVGNDIAPNATVGIGYFRIKPESDDLAAYPALGERKSKKVALGLSLRF